jgi:MoaA/NifB/PqqE/SkfB family radical SAM enzyme
MNISEYPPARKLTVQFNLSIGCNANCFMCDKRVRNEKSKSTYIRLIKLLRFLDPVTVSRIKLLGGEPLLDKKGLLLFLKICRLKGFYCFFPTNGSLITKSYFDAMVQAGLGELTISLDSFDAKEHDAIRGLTGMYKRIIDNLVYIRKHYPKFKLALNFLVLPQNINSLDKTISFAETLGINEFNILHPENFGKNFEQIQLSESSKEKMEYIKSSRPSQKMSINWNPCGVKETPACFCQPNKIIIFEDSDINFCNHYPFRKKYKLNQHISRILNEPEVKDYMNNNTLSCRLRS